VLFGPRYSAVALPARILGAAATVHIAFGFNGLTLDAFGLARPVAVRSAAGILASFVCCPALIPLFGLTGAALSTLVAIVVVNALSSWALLKRFGIWSWDKKLLVTLGGFVVSLALSRLVLLAAGVSHVVECAEIVGCAGLATLASSVIVGGRGELRELLSHLLGKPRPRSLASPEGVTLGGLDARGLANSPPERFPTIDEESR
jgi:O-antigen/teichoic acid export membrane protein